MDKDAIITILITASIAIIVGLIFWYVIVPSTNTTIMILTNNNPVPPSVVDIAFGVLPIAIIAFFMMIIIYTVKSGTFE